MGESAKIVRFPAMAKPDWRIALGKSPIKDTPFYGWQMLAQIECSKDLAPNWWNRLWLRLLCGWKFERIER